MQNLKGKGYTENFNLKDNCLVCHGNSLLIYPNDFVVDEYFRFEGVSDPADEAIVYAISSERHNLKGVLVNGYGIYSDDLTNDMVRKLLPSTDRLHIERERRDAVTTQGAYNERKRSIEKKDLNELAKQLIDDAAEQAKNVLSTDLFKNENTYITLIALMRSGELKKHSTPANLCVQVIEGAMEFHTDENSVALNKGEILTLPAGISHWVKPLRDTVFMLTKSK